MLGLCKMGNKVQKEKLKVQDKYTHGEQSKKRNGKKTIRKAFVFKYKLK